MMLSRFIFLFCASNACNPHMLVHIHAHASKKRTRFALLQCCMLRSECECAKFWYQSISRATSSSFFFDFAFICRFGDFNIYLFITVKFLVHVYAYCMHHRSLLFALSISLFLPLVAVSIPPPYDD